ncbi:LysR family transcriptional regulator [Seleniivibrio woodruffii]|uniref:LysR family transcriptional regulator n=1 Tax=Seleniivibrio woodruffii TaxID=1078050 RepID=UPI0024099567|nr:LysR family transcriptional regulator [Seleniivibrio woodruffii]
MELSIDLLRTFVTIAKVNSYTKASCLLNMTQSAVSMQMKRLEEQTGTLFIKQGKRFSISPTGERLLEHAVRILKAHDDALTVIANPDIHDYIRVCSPELYASSILPNALRKFYAKFPNSRIDFSTNTKENMLRKVENGDLDIAIVADMPEPHEKIYSEKVVWVTSPCKGAAMTRPLPLAVYPEGCHIRRWCIESLEKAGIPYRVSFVASSAFAILSAVRAGIAVAPVGYSRVNGEEELYTVLNNLPALPDNTLSIVTAQNLRSLSAQTLISYIREEFVNRSKMM